jgi:hypothetical protein
MQLPCPALTSLLTKLGLLYIHNDITVQIAVADWGSRGAG